MSMDIEARDTANAAKLLASTALTNTSTVLTRTDPTIRRLREAIAAQRARGVTHLTATPWCALPAWAALTVYYGGERRQNGGNVYVCIGNGTSAASGGPTGTGNGPITDGTVTWYYVGGLTYSADPAAPTYSVSTISPGLPRAYRPASSSWSSGATNIITSNAWFTPWGVYGSTVGDGFIGSPVGDTGQVSFAFATDATSLCIAASVNSAAGIDPFIEIDGRPLIDGVVVRASTSGTQYYNITFASRATRVITVRKLMGAGYPKILGVYCNADARCWAPEKRPGDIVGFWVGDSFSLGQMANYGEGPHRGLVANFFAELGIRRWSNDAYGGTGFAVSSNPYTNPTRLGYISAVAPDIVGVPCSINDSGQGQITYQAAVATWYNAVRTALPNAVIAIFGSMGRTTGTVPNYETWTASLVAGWNAAGDTKVLFIPAAGDPVEPWIKGTGNVTAAGSGSNAGNADAFIGPDATHPVPRGQEYLGRRAATGLINALAALA